MQHRMQRNGDFFIYHVILRMFESPLDHQEYTHFKRYKAARNACFLFVPKLLYKFVFYSIKAKAPFFTAIWGYLMCHLMCHLKNAKRGRACALPLSFAEPRNNRSRVDALSIFMHLLYDYLPLPIIAPTRLSIFAPALPSFLSSSGQ